MGRGTVCCHFFSERESRRHGSLPPQTLCRRVISMTQLVSITAVDGQVSRLWPPPSVYVPEGIRLMSTSVYHTCIDERKRNVHTIKERNRKRDQLMLKYILCRQKRCEKCVNRKYFGHRIIISSVKSHFQLVCQFSDILKFYPLSFRQPFPQR